jgi:hypothetical protein
LQITGSAAGRVGVVNDQHMGVVWMVVCTHGARQSAKGPS